MSNHCSSIFLFIQAYAPWSLICGKNIRISFLFNFYSSPLLCFWALNIVIPGLPKNIPHSFLWQHFHRKVRFWKIEEVYKDTLQRGFCHSNVIFEMLMFSLSWNFIIIIVICILSFFMQQELLALFAVVIWFHDSNWQIQNYKNIYEYMYECVCEYLTKKHCNIKTR